jgi:hypothetical protein
LLDTTETQLDTACKIHTVGNYTGRDYPYAFNSNMYWSRSIAFLEATFCVLESSGGIQCITREFQSEFFILSRIWRKQDGQRKTCFAHYFFAQLFARGVSSPNRSTIWGRLIYYACRPSLISVKNWVKNELAIYTAKHGNWNCRCMRTNNRYVPVRTFLQKDYHSVDLNYKVVQYIALTLTSRTTEILLRLLIVTNREGEN